MTYNFNNTGTDAELDYLNQLQQNINANPNAAIIQQQNTPIVPGSTAGEVLRQYANTAAPVVPQQPVQQPVQQPNQSGSVQFFNPNQPGQPVVQQAPQPVKPVTKDPYNSFLGQAESGNNPNIGYHNTNLSSAYGTYGITAAAYRDIQAADPRFQNRPITSLSPEEQAEANLVYKRLSANSLLQNGIEPTEGNLRVAHFLGPQGASNYLKTGYISPDAAAANGGYEKTKALANYRLTGGNAGGNDAATLFVQSTQNPKQLAAYRNDDTLPIGFRQAAAEQDYDNLSMQKQMAQAQQKYNNIAQSGDWAALGRELKSDSTQGSIFKAMFYRQAGLTDLAKAEEIKMGAGRVWQNIDLADGTQGVVQVGLDGMPIKGYTATGPMDDSQLSQAVGMMVGGKADYVGGSVVNDRTGQIGRIVSKNNRTMIESGGRLYPPTTAWRQNTVGADLQLANNKQLIELQNKLRYMPRVKAAEYIAEFNAKNGTNLTYDEIIPGALNAPGATGNLNIAQQNQVVPGAGGYTQAPTGNAPAAPAQPSYTQPSTTNQGRPATAVAPAPVFREPGFENESPEAFKGRQDAYNAGIKTSATGTAEDLTKVKAGLSKAELNADNMLKTISDVINHPGFSTSVGQRGLTGYFPLRGTDARDWQAKHDQLKGQQFLSAYDQLRGGGSISETEGEKAETAIAALKDPGISEAEFKRNAKILEDVIKTGINNQRAKLGMEPKYKDIGATTESKPGTPVKIKTKEEYDRLPSGTEYTAPDGSKRTKK